MKKFVLIPDSFKGTMSSEEVCDIMAERIKANFCHAEICKIPVADGGEGTVDCFLTALKDGKKIKTIASDPYFDKVESFYGLIDNGKTAIIEMSSVAGLPMVENRLNPMLTTTYGVGELILDAVNKGVTKIIMGLGGSCTNDFGCGMASALGIKFFDNEGKDFIPVGGRLQEIEKIDLSTINQLVKKVEFVTMCDIDNPPYGSEGATEVFSRQKGADEEMVKKLESGVRHICNVINRDYGTELKDLKGGGAAGAMGAGMKFFLSSELKMGIDTVLDTVNFDSIIKDCDYIFTGEGKLDGQSVRGKVIFGIAKRAEKQKIPVIAVVGGSEGDMGELYKNGLNSVFSINRLPQDFSVSRKFSRENLAFAMDNILRLIKN